MIPHSNSKHLPKNNTIFVRKYKKLNVEKFTTELNQVDWSFTSSDSETSVHEDASKFISIIDSLLDKYVPLTKLRNKEYKEQNKPWITKEILAAI